jgi:hypothetical protein
MTRRRDGNTHDSQAGVRPSKDSPARRVRGHVYDVVGCKRRPAQAKAPDGRAETERVPAVYEPRAVRAANVVLRGEAEKDEEDDGDGHPRDAVIYVHLPVADDAKHERDDGDDYNADRVREVEIRDDAERLRAGDAVDRAPADARNDVQERDDLATPPPPHVAGDDHLAEARSDTEDGEICRDGGNNEVDEDDVEDGFAEAEFEQARAEDANCESG